MRGRMKAGSRWLIDGMNVIGSRPNKWWNDPDEAVRNFTDELDRFGSITGEEVTVVFDRHPRDLEPGRHGEVTVLFAKRRGRNAADHEIVQIIAGDKHPASLSVVTSDARLAERVRERGARVVSSGTFRRRLDGASDQAKGRT